MQEKFWTSGKIYVIVHMFKNIYYNLIKCKVTEKREKNIDSKSVPFVSEYLIEGFAIIFISKGPGSKFIITSSKNRIPLD